MKKRMKMSIAAESERKCGRNSEIKGREHSVLILPVSQSLANNLPLRMYESKKKKEPFRLYKCEIE